MAVSCTDDGYSDDGLYSDEEMKPPPNYNLQRRRNAFCVTSANAQLNDDWETPTPSYLLKRRNAVQMPPFMAGDLIPEETRVLAYMKEHGLKPYFPPGRASREEEVTISSDEDEIYFSRRSDESQPTPFAKKSSIKSKNGAPEDTAGNWRAIADAEFKLNKRVPGFLKHTPGYQRPVETVGPVYASAGTTTGTSGSSSTPTPTATKMRPTATADGPKTRSAGMKPIGAERSAALVDKSVFRIM